MKLPVLSVIIPTIDGREGYLDRAVAAYREDARNTDRYELDLVIVRNEPTCGWGWQTGAGRIREDAEFLHFACDDLEPALGWAAAGMAALKYRIMPAPRVLNGSTGEPEYFPRWGVEWEDGVAAGFSCIPMVTRELWNEHVGPMLTAHYWTDNWISHRAGQAGYAPRVVRRYSFRHWWAQEGRGAGMDYDARLHHDRLLFLEACEMAQQGRWNAPWPPREGNDGKVQRMADGTRGVSQAAADLRGMRRG